MLGISSKCFNLIDTMVPRYILTSKVLYSVRYNYTLFTINTTFIIIFYIKEGAFKIVPFMLI